MTTKRNPFLEGLRRRQEATSSTPGETTGKHYSEMSLEELEAEERRMQWEASKAEIERLEERKRAAQSGTNSTGPRAFVGRRQVFSFVRRNRPYWK